MFRSFEVSRSSLVQGQGEPERVTNEILTPHGLRFGQQVAVRGFHGTIVGAAEKYVRPWEERVARVAVTVAIPDPSEAVMTGTHREYLVSEVQGI